MFHHLKALGQDVIQKLLSLIYAQEGLLYILEDDDEQ